jgi:hypothetical protein
MPLFDFFRRKPPIRDLAALSDFIDRNAAFLMQKGIYEYARARAGHYSKVLFGEAEFQDAVEIARWKAYPLGLAMVAEIAEGVLASHIGGARHAGLDVVRNATLAAFDRYPAPAKLEKDAWEALRAELARRLQLIGLHPPKRAMDVPVQYAQDYFDLMPIHEKLRSAEFSTLTNYLKVTLCNIHDELSKRLDGPALAAMLNESAPQA